MKHFINSGSKSLFAALSVDTTEKSLVTVQVWLDRKTAFDIGMGGVHVKSRHIELLQADTDTGQPTRSRGGIAEMLLQSRGGEMKLLPAFSKQWANRPACGLRARGHTTGNIEESKPFPAPFAPSPAGKNSINGEILGVNPEKI